MPNFLEPYNPNWKTEFEELKYVLATELESFRIDIQHVGSTAVPGLFAKPILDIDIVINDKSLLSNVSVRLEKIGYVNKGTQGIPGRFAFKQSSDLTPKTTTLKKWQTHHLYVCFADSLALKNHLIFRDALLSDKNLAAQYAQLKRELATEDGMTKGTYTKRKTDFILSALTAQGLASIEADQIKHENA